MCGCECHQPLYVNVLNPHPDHRCACQGGGPIRRRWVLHPAYTDRRTVAWFCPSTGQIAFQVRSRFHHDPYLPPVILKITSARL